MGMDRGRSRGSLLCRRDVGDLFWLNGLFCKLLVHEAGGKGCFEGR